MIEQDVMDRVQHEMDYRVPTINSKVQSAITVLVNTINFARIYLTVRDTLLQLELENLKV